MTSVTDVFVDNMARCSSQTVFIIALADTLSPA